MLVVAVVVEEAIAVAIEVVEEASEVTEVAEEVIGVAEEVSAVVIGEEEVVEVVQSEVVAG